MGKRLIAMNIDVDPDETAPEALDDRTLLEIRAEETAWERAPAELQDAIETFDREAERAL